MGEICGIFKSDPYAAHAGVDLHVYIDRQTTFKCISAKAFGDATIINNRCQRVFDDQRCLSRPKRAQAKNWQRNPRFSKLDAFLREGDAKPVDTFCLEP